MFCVRGRVEFSFILSRCFMRRSISGVKLELKCFLLPRGMCALSALVMMELKCAIVVSMLVIGMKLRIRNCCSVCSVKDGQFARL